MNRSRRQLIRTRSERARRNLELRTAGRPLGVAQYRITPDGIRAFLNLAPNEVRS